MASEDEIGRHGHRHEHEHGHGMIEYVTTTRNPLQMINELNRES